MSKVTHLSQAFDVTLGCLKPPSQDLQHRATYGLTGRQALKLAKIHRSVDRKMLLEYLFTLEDWRYPVYAGFHTPGIDTTDLLIQCLDTWEFVDEMAIAALVEHYYKGAHSLDYQRIVDYYIKSKYHTFLLELLIIGIPDDAARNRAYAHMIGQSVLSNHAIKIIHERHPNSLPDVYRARIGVPKGHVDVSEFDFCALVGSPEHNSAELTRRYIDTHGLNSATNLLNQRVPIDLMTYYEACLMGHTLSSLSLAKIIVPHGFDITQLVIDIYHKERDGDRAYTELLNCIDTYPAIDLSRLCSYGCYNDYPILVATALLGRPAEYGTWELGRGYLRVPGRRLTKSIRRRLSNLVPHLFE